MNLNDLHRRLLRDVLEIGNALPFVITGGYAVQAHGLVDRLSQDIDVATESFQSMDKIASMVVDGLATRGWRERVIGWKAAFTSKTKILQATASLERKSRSCARGHSSGLMTSGGASTRKPLLSKTTTIPNRPAQDIRQ